MDLGTLGKLLYFHCSVLTVMLQHYIQFLCGVYLMGVQVILGGGRKYMYPKDTPDVEYPNEKQHYGTRKDGRNLIDEWKDRMKEKVSAFLSVFLFPPTLCYPSHQLPLGLMTLLTLVQRLCMVPFIWLLVWPLRKINEYLFSVRSNWQIIYIAYR